MYCNIHCIYLLWPRIDNCGHEEPQWPFGRVCVVEQCNPGKLCTAGQILDTLTSACKRPKAEGVEAWPTQLRDGVGRAIGRSSYPLLPGRPPLDFA